MARRKKYKAIVDPLLKASTVVATYVGQWKKKKEEWKKNYDAKIEKYVGDEGKQLRAIVALGGYYAGFTPEVKGKIREAVQEAVANKDRVLAEFEKTAKEKGIKPIVPEKAEELSKKVAELITI